MVRRNDVLFRAGGQAPETEITIRIKLCGNLHKMSIVFVIFLYLYRKDRKNFCRKMHKKIARKYHTNPVLSRFSRWAAVNIL